jgi:hypothetical protein
MSRTISQHRDEVKARVENIERETIAHVVGHARLIAAAPELLEEKVESNE